MDKPRPCGCKGRRTCLICENEYGIVKEKMVDNENSDSYVFCPWCDRAYPGWDIENNKQHPNHEGHPLTFPGVFLQFDFITVEEECQLMKGIDEMKWDQSQSGRRKQNFGPKCNFKKKRLKLGKFNGFPLFTKFVQDKFTNVPILQGFRTVEQCSLEYDPARGASIDPHIDDCWVWGERVVTVNLLSDSVLTMTYYKGSTDRYNLSCVADYPCILDNCGQMVYKNFSGNSAESERKNSCYKLNSSKEGSYPIVRIPMPKRSLLVIYGSARYDWEHSVLREDITERRVCLAYREFTPPYLYGKFADYGKDILKCSEIYWNPVDV